MLLNLKFLFILTIHWLAIQQIDSQSVESCGQLDEKLLNNHKKIAEPNEYPWIVTMGFGSADPPDKVKYTGQGVLLNKRVVITTIGCLKYESKNVTEILVGNWINQRAAQTYQVDDIIVNPTDDPNPWAGIVLLRLVRNVVFGTDVQPICLPSPRLTHNDLVTKHLYVATISTAPPREKEVQKTFAHVMSTLHCAEFFSSRFDHEKHICGWVNTSYVEIFNSAPLMDVNVIEGQPRNFYLVGIPSYYLIGDRNVTGFLSIIPHLQWIKKMLGQNDEVKGSLNITNCGTLDEDSIHEANTTTLTVITNDRQNDEVKESLNITNCGTLDEDSIHEANTSTLPYEYPWAALIAYREDGTNTTLYHCQGVLLSKRTVITLNRCLYTYLDEIFAVVLGDWTSNDQQLYAVHEVIQHPIRRPDKYISDVGLVRLSRDVHFNIQVQPICLPPPELTNTDLVAKRLFVGGLELGLPGLARERLIKRKTFSTIMSSRRCYRIFGSVINEQHHLCGPLSNSSIELTPGAGLLDVKVEDGHPVRFFLVGLTSFGTGTGKIVYTSIIPNMQWIRNNLE